MVTQSWQRIKEVIEFFEMNKNSFSKEIGLSNNVTIGRIINEKRKPSEATLLKIVQRFPSIDLDWLKTGKGTMLVKGYYEPPKIYYRKDNVSISLAEITNFVVENEKEFLKQKAIKNMIELRVAKKLLEVVKDIEKFKAFVTNK